MEELLSKLAELEISLEARGSELDIYDPRQALTHELLTDIKSNKPGLLALLKDVSGEWRHDPIPAAAQKTYYSLSYAQKRLYFLYQFDQASIAYNMPRVLRLEGEIDSGRLDETFRRLIAHHESLRTSFVMMEDGAVQKIAARVEFSMTSLAAGSGDAQQLARSFVRPFDLSCAPLFRAGIQACGAGYSLLILDMHHIIADGMSQNIMINDFIALYKGETLPEPDLRYKDYSEWQQSPAYRLATAGQKDFWMRKFSQEALSLQLPADFLRPPILRYAGSSISMTIGREETEHLQVIAAAEEATLFMVLLSVYVIFLSRISNREDIVVGSPTAGRHHPGLGNVVGVFLNMLPLRNRPEAHLTFREFLSQVKINTLSSLDNQDYQYEELVDTLKIERDASRNPLFDVLFDFANYLQSGISIPGLSIGTVDILHEVAKFDLSLSAVLLGDRIQLQMEYSTSLFRRETIERFMGYFTRLVSAVIENPDVRIGDMRMLPEKEVEQLLSGFNDTVMPLPSEETIVSLFQRQVSLNPDKTAVVYKREHLTYRALNEKADRLAHYLQTQKALKPDDIVGIMADRSIAMIIGLLGIMKAGAAYLPIDPSYPQERAEYMLSDSGAGILLMDKMPPDGFRYIGEVLLLNGILSYKDESDFAGAVSICSATDLCYLIYTSGSTGLPKGVMITHRNVVNFMMGLSRNMPVSPTDCMLAVTSTSFDISVLELFWTLCNGVEVVIHPSDHSLTGLDGYLPQPASTVDFSLLFFSSYDLQQQDKYRLLLESAKYADRMGFKAIWTPERHFHEFGGLYPNPSVTSAALAMITEQIALRCGSVVSPLHDPLRVAEEWSMVDNLSNGRVGLSFAPGWNANDFVLNPDGFSQRQKTMYEQIGMVRQLWKGASVLRTNGLGKEVPVRIFPQPVQQELPVWVTSGGTAETFKRAGAIGANILTHLLGQDLGELAEKINVYRAAAKEHGHDGKGIVTIMLHTYIGNTIAEVESVVEAPFIAYLKSSIGLTRLMAEESNPGEEEISAERQEMILKNAFRRYYKTGALIGTKATCGEMIRKLAAIGIDEIACLIDFGIKTDIVLQALEGLHDLKESFCRPALPAHRPITMMQSTPSFIRMVQEGEGSKSFLRSLRVLLLGGESLPLSLVRKLKQETGAIICNMYGPTETTIWSCMHVIEAAVEKVLVGRPMGNTQIYILDKQLRLVAMGVPGELYIGGDGLARGYWNRPELTFGKFIINPYNNDKKIYNTGDIARWMPDGAIELLGREDQQVKIRGHRIELGEIEHQLSACEGVRESVVSAFERDGDKFIVAYYVAQKELAAEELRGHLAGKLPEYMVPSYLVHMPALPLTPNGKIDRKALPPPLLTAGRDYEAPVGDTEERLADIWAEILNMDRESISATEDFFRLGGHSLNAMVAVARTGKRFGRKIPLKVFYSISTIRAMARYIEASDSRHNDIRPAAEQPHYPLSSQQKRMYFLHELDRSSLAYNETGIYELKGQLDRKKLADAFAKLIQRHEILRTTFEWIQQEPRQKISASADFDIAYCRADGQEEKVIKEFIRPFDLDRSPLFRAGIIQRSEGDHLLIVDMHHIITDGISKGLLVKDFMALYQEQELPAPAFHYKDYVAWLQEEAQQAEVVRQRSFWTKLFEEEAPLLDLPADAFRPSVKTYSGSVCKAVLGPEETGRLRRLAKEERTTLYILLLAIYNIVLGKLSNQDDIIIGTPTAGRQHADLEKVMGMFVNTIPLRNYPAGNLGFRSFLQEVKSRTLECLDNQAYPYEELIDELKVERNAGRNPLFDALFVFHNFDMFQLGIPGLALTTYERTYNISKFDITLEVFEKDDALVLNVEYATELFRQATIDRFIAGFRRVVDAVISDADRKISAIKILSFQEEQLLLHGFNSTGAPYPAEDTLSSLFEKQVERSPAAIAFRYGQDAISYGLLKERADKVAAFLVEEKCVRPGDLVGVMLQRDEYLIPAIFGILKAGGVYVPIDPHYPPERIKAILADSKMQVLMTRTAFRHVVPDMPHVIELDTEWAAIECRQSSPIHVTTRGGDLAYVIYTSGSTGHPKGVMIEHHSVVNRLEWMQREYPIGPGDVLLQKTPIVFDVSVWELFWWALTGASLVLLEQEGEKDPRKISDVIISHGVTVIHFVPSMLHAYLTFLQAGGSAEGPDTLRFVFASGEALKAVHVQLFTATLRRLSPSRLINLYGPTEATVDVAYYACAADGSDTVVPIGKPISNIRLYILDKNDRLAPLGVAGELCIAGAGLARGYLNNEGLTQQRFTSLPDLPGERIYRTGDLAKWTPEGNVLFLGRIDHQVKIRGFRIEPEEIEGQMMRYPGIKEAVVIARERYGEKYLTGYYVSESPLMPGDWKAHLSLSLPGYMIPAYFVRMDSLPVTSNGKLNRKALPEPDVDLSGGYIVPAGEIEQGLAEIWATALNLQIEKISAAASFFELGGHSLKALQVMDGIRSTFSVELGLRTIFEQPTIRQLAQIIVQSAVVAGPVGGDEIPSAGERPSYAASSAQERLFFEQMLDEEGLKRNISVAYRIEGAFDLQQADSALRLLGNRHESLRTAFSLSADGVIQVIGGQAGLKLMYPDASKYKSVEDAFEDFVKPFDLSRPPLMRCAFLQSSALGRFLFVDIHHIICDGISLDILMNDFKKALTGVELSFSRLRYVDYAHWQKSRSMRLQNEERFWMRLLEGRLPAIGLPVLRQREAASAFPSARKMLVIEGAQLQVMQDHLSALAVSDFIFLLSVYFLVVAKISGREDIIIGTDAMGRKNSALKSIVGTFVNVLPLRLRVEKHIPFARLLLAVKDLVLEAFDQQEYPFDQMISWADTPPGRRLVDVYFSHRAFFESHVGTGDLAFVPLAIHSQAAVSRYELELDVEREPGKLRLTFLYNTGLYDDEIIAAFIACYSDILTTVVGDVSTITDHLH
jgi:natural product biosynthesis luciferase-like monooxygenase protein/amino acid adenylation domain-containing protein